MTSFAYRAATVEGRRVAGELEAASSAEVRRHLQRLGLYPLRIGPAARRPGAVRLDWARLLPRSRREQALRFTRDVATFLDAGFPLERCLGLCAETAGSEEVARVAADLRGGVREGKPLSEALEGHPRLFSDLYVSLVRAGEEAAALPEVMDRLARYLERRQEVGARLRSALVYPALMAVVGGVAVLILVLVVIPRFVGILEGGEQALPLSTRLVMGASAVVSGSWWLLALAFGVGAWLLRRYRETAHGRLRLDALELRVPLWGRFRLEWATALFCRTLETLLASGVSFPGAVATAGSTVPNRALAGELDDLVVKVKRGKLMGDVLGESRTLPRLAVQMIRTGEEAGRLQEMLAKAADIYEGRVERSTTRAVAMVEPLLVLLFGLVVGLVAFAMLEAVYSISRFSP